MTYIKVNKSPHGTHLDELEMTSEHGRLYLTREQCVVIVRHAAHADMQEEPEEPTEQSKPVNHTLHELVDLRSQYGSFTKPYNIATQAIVAIENYERIIKEQSDNITVLKAKIQTYTKDVDGLQRDIKVANDKLEVFYDAVTINQQNNTIAAVDMNKLTDAVNMV